MLKDWLTQTRQLAAEYGRGDVADIVIGQWLAKSPSGSEGCV